MAAICSVNSLWDLHWTSDREAEGTDRDNVAKPSDVQELPYYQHMFGQVESNVQKRVVAE